MMEMETNQDLSSTKVDDLSESMQLADGLEGEPREKKTKYMDGWPEDRWEEEMEKHPFFMTKTPDTDDELHPLMEGLQKLKYDEEENTPEELAMTYLHEGDINFKAGRFDRAIINFNEGLKYNCSADLKARLYNNCAAAHHEIENNRTSLEYSKAAVKLNPNLTEAEFRVVECLFRTNDYVAGLAICDHLLSKDPNNIRMINLKKNAIKDKKLYDCERRKRIMRDTKLMHALKERKIKTQDGRLEDLSQLEPKVIIPGDGQIKVHLEDGKLIWCVAVYIPEYNVINYINSCNEDTTFRMHFTKMFETPSEWDKNKKYKVDNIRIYHTDYEEAVEVSMDETIKFVLSNEMFVVRDGIPEFFVFSKKSKAEAKFLLDPESAKVVFL